MEVCFYLALSTSFWYYSMGIRCCLSLFPTLWLTAPPQNAGTDHPFFPPLADEEGVTDEKWLSVTTNVDAVEKTFEGEKEEGEKRASLVKGILGGNARVLLKLTLRGEVAGV